MKFLFHQYSKLILKGSDLIHLNHLNKMNQYFIKVIKARD